MYENLIVSLHEGTSAFGTAPSRCHSAMARAIEEYLFLACLLPASHHHTKPQDMSAPSPATTTTAAAGERAALQIEAVEQEMRSKVFEKFAQVVRDHQSRSHKEGVSHPTAKELAESTRIISTSIRTMH